MKEFKVNEYITIKFEENLIKVYVSEKPVYKIFSRFAHLKRDEKNLALLEQEFKDHCIYIKKLVENDFDIRSFPNRIAVSLIISLSKEGIPAAKQAFVNELKRRYESGDFVLFENLLFNEDLDFFSEGELQEFNFIEDAIFNILKLNLDYYIKTHYWSEDGYESYQKICKFIIFRTSESILNFFQKLFSNLSEEQKVALVSFLLVDKNYINQEIFDKILIHLKQIDWGKIGEIIIPKVLDTCEKVKLNVNTISLLENGGIPLSNIILNRIKWFLSEISLDYNKLYDEISYNVLRTLLKSDPNILSKFLSDYYSDLNNEEKCLFLTLFLLTDVSNAIPIDDLKKKFEQLDPLQLSEIIGKVIWYSFTPQEDLNKENLKKLGEIGVKIVLYVLTRDFRYQFDKGDGEFWEYYADLLKSIGTGYDTLIKEEAYNVFYKENREDFTRRFKIDVWYESWVWYLLRILKKKDIMELLFDPKLRIFEQIDLNSYLREFKISQSDRINYSKSQKSITEQEVMNVLDMNWKSEKEIINILNIKSEDQFKFLIATLWKFLDKEEIITDIKGSERIWKLYDSTYDISFKTTFRNNRIDKEDKKVLEELEHLAGVPFTIIKPPLDLGLNHGRRMEVSIEDSFVTRIGIFEVKLWKFPESLQKLHHLYELRLISNQMEQLPAEIKNLKQLKFLYLSGNLFITLPKNIGSLNSLEMLYIVNFPTIEEVRGILIPTRLQSLPDSIGELKNLKFLHLMGNHLKILPNSIGDLLNLEELNIAWNYIEKLPQSIGNLKNLKKMHLSNNLLLDLPDSMKNLDSLEEISLKDNPRKTLLFDARKGKLNIPHWLANLKSLRNIIS
ncbi:MAG: leucine-rich repeat domain-containing protein [Promethearchaeota archaeon]|nr:MAG: leucine-rich repeat domain-containing protein [Candidatus Lokiarchaeota archaeon]